MTRTLTAIDPGVRKNAIAEFVSGELVNAAYAPTIIPDLVVIERPQIDARTRGIDPSNILALAWSGAMLAGELKGQGAKVKEYTPTQWKGSEPKPLQHLRMIDVLGKREKAVLDECIGPDWIDRVHKAVEKGALKRWKVKGADCYGRWEGHNLLDAVALGLFELGRLKKI
jgi:hypothetical protein